jgi:hypothetical protein
VLLLNECLWLKAYISLSTQSGNFRIHLRILGSRIIALHILRSRLDGCKLPASRYDRFTSWGETPVLFGYEVEWASGLGACPEIEYRALSPLSVIQTELSQLMYMLRNITLVGYLSSDE